MSEVSDNTYDVFVAMANPEHTSAGAVGHRMTRSKGSPIREEVEGNDDSDDDANDDDDDDNDDFDEDEEEEDRGSRTSRQSLHNMEPRSVSPTRGLVEEEEDDDEPDVQRRDRSVVDEADDEGDDDESHIPSMLRAPSRVAPSRVAPPPPNLQAFTEFMNTMPTRTKTREELQAEAMEKQSMLMDLERLRDNHGVVMTREWSMEDDYDDMAFELKRIMLHIDETNNISSMRSGLQLACTGIEMLSKRFKILDLDGWSAEVCRDMSKHDRALGRMYRKYWRRSHSNSPEADVALSLVSSMGMFHMRKSMSKRMFRGAGGSSSIPRASNFGSSAPSSPRIFEEDDDDDDEDLPPMS